MWALSNLQIRPTVVGPRGNSHFPLISQGANSRWISVGPNGSLRVPSSLSILPPQKPIEGKPMNSMAVVPVRMIKSPCKQRYSIVSRDEYQLALFSSSSKARTNQASYPREVRSVLLLDWLEELKRLVQVAVIRPVDFWIKTIVGKFKCWLGSPHHD
jgi:hypothetical protein